MYIYVGGAGSLRIMKEKERNCNREGGMNGKRETEGKIIIER